MKQGKRKCASFSEYLVSDEDAGQRLDSLLSGLHQDMSRSRIQKLIRDEMVSIQGEVCTDKNYRLQAGETIKLIVPLPEAAGPEPENIQLDIIFEDGDLLVINKPRGMVVHPAPGHSGGTLVNALLGYCKDLSGIGGVARPGIVHRLDKDTSGLLIVAKNDLAHNSLSAQLKRRKLTREYIALTYGIVKPEKGRIEAPIGRHPRHRKKMAVVMGGREAITRYTVLKHYDNFSLLRVKLETGRTHQIRVHLAYIGYPIVGDPAYTGGGRGGLPDDLVSPQALHAYRLTFTHPRSGETIRVSAPLPPEFRAALFWLNR